MSKTYYHVTLDAVVEVEDLEDAYAEAVKAVTRGEARITIMKQGGARAALIAKGVNDLMVKLAQRVKVDSIDWSTRTRNQLDYANIKTLGELSKWSADELLARKGFGRTCLDEVEAMLCEYDLALRESQAEMQLEAAE
jgi:DNA-directed RNA polymerase alpha subunit